MSFTKNANNFLYYRCLEEHGKHTFRYNIVQKKWEKIKKDIWKVLDLIRVYCKEPGKKPEKKALVLEKGSTVEDAAEKVHKDFVKYFKFARVWGSSKFPGEKVGIEYKLKDKDIVEIHWVNICIF